VTVHANHFGLNIAHDNNGIRAESIRQYWLAAHLAVDVGARALTFHPGFVSRAGSDPAVVLERNVAFFAEIATFCEREGIVAGVENVGSVRASGMLGLAQSELLDLIDAVGSPAFGLLLDVGWAIKTHAGKLRGRNAVEAIIEPWCELFRDRIVEVHLHGCMPTGPFEVVHHVALSDDLTLRPDALRQQLRSMKPMPLVFEIMASQADDVVRLAAQDADLLALDG